MSDLPDLHGWLPARVLARRLGVSPGTVRARARKGALDAIPNPAGPGALYRAQGRSGPTPSAPGVSAATEVGTGFVASANGLSRDDGLILAHLPGSTARIAVALGASRGSVHRSLTRLERAGCARRGDPVPSGPRGGRPEIPWQSVA